MHCFSCTALLKSCGHRLILGQLSQGMLSYMEMDSFTCRKQIMLFKRLSSHIYVHNTHIHTYICIHTHMPNMVEVSWEVGAADGPLSLCLCTCISKQVTEQLH